MGQEELKITSIRKVSDLFEKLLQRKCAELAVNEGLDAKNLTATEIMFISEVSSNKTAVQIAKDLCVTKALISITAKKLIDKGYITTEKSLVDRRSSTLSFTPKGIKLKRVIEAVRVEIINKAEKLVSPDGIKVINVITEILLLNMKN